MSSTKPPNDQVQQRWKSPLLQIATLVSASAEMHTNDNDEAPSLAAKWASSSGTESSVIIPHAGWFGLCFGSAAAGESDKEREDVDNDQERNMRREVKSGIITTRPQNAPKNKERSEMGIGGNQKWYLKILNQYVETQKETAVEIAPLQDEKGGILSDTGNLYYFPEHSSVSLVCTTGSDKNRDDNDSQDNNNNNSNDKNPPLQWYLVSRQLNANLDTIQPGGAYKAKKSILCSTCQKLFPSIRAATSHRQSMHKVTKNDKNICGNNTQNDEKGYNGDRTNQPSQPRDFYNNTSLCLPEALEVIYQDNHLAVVNKPQGIAVMGDTPSLCRSDVFMPLAGPTEDSRHGASLSYLRKPVPVHRLDAATGGLLVLAKTKDAERQLKACFASRVCQKQYRALIWGRLEPFEGCVEIPMDGNKPAVTRYQVHQYHRTVLEQKGNGWVTVVNLYPETGRKHQLRKHMKSLGHPIWGDKRYGGFLDDCDMFVRGKTACDGAPTATGQSIGYNQRENDNILVDPLMSRLCLWAMKLTLPHPITSEELKLTLKDPEWLTHIIHRCAVPTKVSAEGED